MKKKYDYLIVGAGLYGATIAHELHKAGLKCLVIDKRSHIGGNVYTEERDGIHVHVYGAHIFHTSNERVNSFIRQFASFNDFINTPLANYLGTYYNLPFNMNTFEKLFNVKTKEEAIKRIEDEKKKYGVSNPINLEEQAISLVGKTVYETLVKGYTEKQWGKPCDELPPSIIKRIPVRYEYNNNYFDDIYQGIPIGGYTKMVENMLQGIEVILNCDYLKNKDNFDADNIIYTGPIDEYYNYEFGALEYRSLRFEIEHFKNKTYQDVAVVNYTDSKTPYTRIIEHKHFDYSHQKDTIITKEYPSDWDTSKEPFYPINNERNIALYNKYLELAKREKCLTFAGRLGLYRYLDMDDVILLALEKADEILKRSA